MRVGKLCRGYALLVGCVKPAVADVIHNSTRKQVYILQNNAQRPAQIGFLYLVDIYTVVPYLAVCNIVKTVYKVGNCGFACARSAHKCYFLSRLCVNINVMQHYFIGNIAEINIEQPHVTHKSGICHRAVVMGMTPCPNARALFALGYIAVFINICVYKGNVAVIRLGLFVHKLEYTLGTCHSHNYRVYLLRYLAYAHGKLSRHIKERHHHRHRNCLPRKGKVGRVCNNQNTADKGYKHIQNIAYVAHYRH